MKKPKNRSVVVFNLLAHTRNTDRPLEYNHTNRLNGMDGHERQSLVSPLLSECSMAHRSNVS